MADSDTATTFRRFAVREARGNSDLYESVARAIAADPDLVAAITALPPPSRQPNLILGAARYLGIGDRDATEWVAWIRQRWSDVAEVALRRRTQTNEAARMATLLPVFAGLPGPLALIEVGASAGLCLYPDRVGYRYRPGPVLTPAAGTPPVELSCTVTGRVPFPRDLPEVVHRVGIDPNPLDVTDADDMRWLEALIWPGRPERVARLRAVAEIARAEPPVLLCGDLVDTVAAAVRAVPAGSTAVVFHSAVLGYLDRDHRRRFVDLVTELPCHWVSNEASGVVCAAPELPEPADGARFVVTHDAVPVAVAAPHGQELHWLPDT